MAKGVFRLYLAYPAEEAVAYKGQHQILEQGLLGQYKIIFPKFWRHLALAMVGPRRSHLSCVIDLSLSACRDSGSHESGR